jgi:hypothetical protein
MKTNQLKTLTIKPSVLMALALMIMLACLAGCNAATPLPSTATPVPPTPTDTPVPPTPTFTPIPPTPTITETPITPETIMFDTRKNEVKSKMILVDGHTYTIRISGTYSNWDGAYWAQYGVCAGTPDTAPVYQRLNTANSPVGQDAFYWYAYPKGPGTVSLCGKATPPAPDKFLKFSLNGGSTFYYWVSVPDYNSSHTYTITWVGKNFPLIIDLNDTDFSDNQGMFKIEILS